MILDRPVFKRDYNTNINLQKKNHFHQVKNKKNMIQTIRLVYIDWSINKMGKIFLENVSDFVQTLFFINFQLKGKF